MLISVIITTYNRSDALLAVLDGLRNQSDTNFEVVIADDGSADAHVLSITEHPKVWPFAVRHVWHPDLGFTAATARNLGVAQSSGDYLVLMDGDCVPQPDFIERHRRLARPGCFVNGSRVLLDLELSQVLIRSGLPAPRSHPGLWLNWRMHAHCNKLLCLLLRWSTASRHARKSFHWKGIRSCNMGVWRRDYEAIDGFDQAFNGWVHEDADFVLRLHNLGRSRIDGWWATEVLHLWHREAPRSDAAGNRQRVLDRMQEQPPRVRASIGLSSPPPPQLRVTELRTNPPQHMSHAYA